MTAPEAGAVRFAVALAVGAVLGLLYGFLRPLRPKHTLFADGVFLLGTYLGWIWWAFAICAADPRIVGLGAMALGAFLWENTAGRLLRPIFRYFWTIIGKMWHFITWPAKKISKQEKFCLHL